LSARFSRVNDGASTSISRKKKISPTKPLSLSSSSSLLIQFKAAANRRERAKGEEDLFFEENYSLRAVMKVRYMSHAVSKKEVLKFFFTRTRARDFGENFQKSTTGISKKSRARVLLLFFSRFFATASSCLV
jgi:hypothetical protein